VSGAAVQVDGVSKRFKLASVQTTSIKERMLGLDRRSRQSRQRERWALRDISFDVQEGQTLGLLGHNGSGKSTLLKCIAGILKPSSGSVSARGRMASLLELGAGFHPDLTGRENVFINASFLGMSQRDIERHFDEIVAFAELEELIDQQVKYYSSGEFVRLGFAVATNVDPDILLVDEVLAVGDEKFQLKCLDRVAQFQAEGRTILFVTHSTDLVRRICDRAVVLDHGRMVADAAPGDAIRVYREHLHLQPVTDPSTGHGAMGDRRLRITHVHFDFPGAGERRYLYAGQPLTVSVGYETTEPVEGAVVALDIHEGADRLLIGLNTDSLGLELPVLEGKGEVVFELESVPMSDGEYLVSVAVKDRTHALLDWRERVDTLEVANPTRQDGAIYVPSRALFKPE
jgi:ABC-2 type transport system ATP-binding protein